MVEENAQNALELPSPQDLDEYDLETDDAEYYEPEIPQVAQLNCGDIVIKDSSNVQVGNRTYITGQVTIKQIVVPGDETKLALPIGSIPEGLSSGPVRSTNPLCESKEVPTGEKLQQFISHCIQSPRNIVLSLCAAVLLFGVIFTIIYMSTSKVQDGVKPLSSNTSSRILSRDEWGAEKTGIQDPLAHYRPKCVIIAHTAGSNCSSTSTCSTIVRNIQALHFANDWDDIAYNFLVGGDGFAYEGRGWDKKGAHTYKYNRNSICIAFIGNFMNYLPPKRQIEAAKIVIEEGIRLGKLPSNYTLLYHKQITGYESPGTKLIEQVKTWDHWTEHSEECLDIP